MYLVTVCHWVCAWGRGEHRRKSGKWRGGNPSTLPTHTWPRQPAGRDGGMERWRGVNYAAFIKALCQWRSKPAAFSRDANNMKSAVRPTQRAALCVCLFSYGMYSIITRYKSLLASRPILKSSLQQKLYGPCRTANSVCLDLNSGFNRRRQLTPSP